MINQPNLLLIFGPHFLRICCPYGAETKKSKINIAIAEKPKNHISKLNNTNSSNNIHLILVTK